jgi:hypothetical protein
VEAKRYVPGSKWKKHQIVLRSEAVRHHLPHTALYSRKKLSDMAQRHDVLFLKPEYGTGGKGVMQLARRDQGGWLLKDGRRQWTCATLDEVQRRVEGRRGVRLLIQQGIDLARWKGRPADLRTVVQKNERNEWEISAMAAKSAGSGLAVTNVCAGGTAHRVVEYLRGLGFSREKEAETLRRLRRLTFDVARACSGYANVTFGLDIGLDHQGRLWLIEVNTVPDREVYRKMGLLKIYRRVMKLWRLRMNVNAGAKALARKKPVRRTG